MIQHDNVEKNDRQDRYQRRHTYAEDSIDEDKSIPRRRRAPYKREQVDYDHYLQEELEDEWFGFNN